MEIPIGARNSCLSKEQVAEVCREISIFHPDLQFTPVWTVTGGDKDRTTPLWSVSKTDFFTREIDEKLLRGECRIAVHSAKDLPSPLPEGLSIIALTQGADPRDSLVMPPMTTLETLPKNARVGTSSKRREVAIKALREDLCAVDIRGTIDERLELLHTGAVDAVIIAEAALIRLKRTGENRILLDSETETLQGKLAVIARSDDHEIASLFAPLDTRKRVAVVGPSVPQRLKNDPSLSVVHSSLIHLQLIPVSVKHLRHITAASGVILTSKHAASFLHETLQGVLLPLNGLRFFCVGHETATVTRALFPASEILIARDSTQEGLVDLIVAHRPGALFWPRSTHARKYLPEALEKAGIALTEFPLYTPVPAPEPCSLQGIDIVFFTCPSSVDAFFDVTKKGTWEHLSMQAIGPVTKARLEKRRAVSSPPSSSFISR